MSAGSQDFVSVYDEHVWDVYGFFGYRLASKDEVEDLVQATFERALQRVAALRPRARQRPHVAADDRAETCSSTTSAATPAARRSRWPRASSPTSSSAARRRSRSSSGSRPSSRRRSSELSDRERELIALRFGGDLNGPEIAELTGLSLANVQQILSRSLRRMRAELEPEHRARAVRD